MAVIDRNVVYSKISTKIFLVPDERNPAELCPE